MIEKTMYGDAVVYLKFIPATEYLKMEGAVPSSVHGFPIKNDSILFTVNPRGIDIIGGHIEKGETSEIALIRESDEEASIKPTDFTLIGAIEVDNRDNPKAIEAGYPPKGYQLFYAIKHYETFPFEATHECTSRQYVKIEDIQKTHHKWLKTHENILDEMKSMLKITKKPKLKM